MAACNYDPGAQEAKKDCCKFKTSLGYTVLGYLGLQNETLSQKQTTKFHQNKKPHPPKKPRKTEGHKVLLMAMLRCDTQETTLGHTCKPSPKSLK